MRSALIPPFVALACVATVALARPSAPAAQDPDGDAATVEALAAEVAQLRFEIERLTAESTDLSERTAALEGGFQTMSKSAQELMKTLDRSEEQGFTAGINFESRVTLLTGWRKHLGALKSAGPRDKRSSDRTR